jgi:hypothetical protein
MTQLIFRRGAAWCAALFLASLAGCSDTLSGSNDAILVTPSSATVAAVVGGSQSVHISFYSNDGSRQSLLSVTGAGGALPAGWSGPANFQCPTVTTGNGCVLNLTYSPLATGTGTLILNYTYLNTINAPRTGSLTLAYSATADNHILATASPAGEVVAVSNSSQNVAITFATDDGTAATALSVTSALTALPAGWHSASSTFGCPRVSAGSGCQLALTFAPTAIGNGTLTLDYGYTDSAGAAQTGTVTIAYAATVHDNVAASANPAVLQVFTGSTTAVGVTFDTDDGNVASGLTVTSDLGALPAGWSSATGTFACTAVSSGAGCQLSLSYAPMVSASGTLALNFSYTDNAGMAKTGSVSIPYQASVEHFYFTNTVANSIEVCEVAGDGTIMNCQDSGGTGFNYPMGITFQGSNLYVANYGGNTVSVCTLDADATVSNCLVTGSGFAGPMAVTFNPGGTLAYVANNSGSAPSVCTVNPDGSLTHCVAAISGISSSADVAFLPGGALAYLTAGSSLFLCTLATDGTFADCTDSAVNTNYAFSVAVAGGSLYFTAENGLTGAGAMLCSLGAGSLPSGCQPTALAAPSDTLLISGGYAYLATDGGPSGLFRCTLNSDASLGSCVAQTDPAILNPWGMAIR